MSNFVLWANSHVEIQTLYRKIHVIEETINLMKIQWEFYMSFFKDRQLLNYLQKSHKRASKEPQKSIKRASKEPQKSLKKASKEPQESLKRASKDLEHYCLKLNSQLDLVDVKEG